MYQRIAICTLILFSLWSQAQSGSGYGIKGGLNYNTNGNYYESANQVAQDPTGHVGYHIGLFGKIGSSFYVRPELVYTTTKSGYGSDTFKMEKLDLPVIAGIHVLGPVHVFGGAALQYIMNSKFAGITIGDLKDDFTVGMQFGLGVNLGSLGIDLRYEQELNSNIASFINTNLVALPNSRIDARSSQIILSLSLKL